MRLRIHNERKTNIMWHEIGEEFETFITGGYITLHPLPGNCFKSGLPTCFLDIEIPNQISLAIRKLKKHNKVFLPTCLPGITPSNGIYGIIFEVNGDTVSAVVIRDEMVEEDVVDAIFDLLGLVAECVNMKTGTVREIII